MSEPLDEVLAENAAERDGLRKMVADLESKLAAVTAEKVAKPDDALSKEKT